MGDAFLPRENNIKWSQINTTRNCNCQTSGIVDGDPTSIDTMYSWYLTNAFLPSDDGSGVNPIRAGEFKCGQILTGEIIATPETPVAPYNDANNGTITLSLLPEGVVTDSLGDKCYEFRVNGTICGPQSAPSATVTNLDSCSYTATLKDALTCSCIVQQVTVNLGGGVNSYRQLQNNNC
jgi:hypothetical protein